MKRIYIKNYKGFFEQTIDLVDVNFFVGENSTGKTSILKLINILNNRDFWFTTQFNNPEVELGYFDEIKNKNSTDNFFAIGIETDEFNDIDEEKEESSKVQRVLLEFKEHKSIPKLQSLKFVTLNKDVLVKITPKQIQYRVKESTESNFDEWVKDFAFPKKYNRFEAPFYKFPIFLIFSVIETALDKDFDNDKKVKRTIHFASDPVLFKKYLWLAPIRAKAKRIYESYEIKFSPEGDHIPSLLRDMFSNSSKKERQRILDILNQFGAESNLYDEIIIKNYGSKNASPFEILVDYQGTEIKLPNVGYGVSQSLPLIVEVLSSKGYTFSIQQPEVHLHPKAQAAFGSFIYNAAKQDKNKFLIETHSDYTINRFRYAIAKRKDRDIQSQIIFFERTSEGNKINVLKIAETGSFVSDVPQSYREFFIDEELKLLEL